MKRRLMLVITQLQLVTKMGSAVPWLCIVLQLCLLRLVAAHGRDGLCYPTLFSFGDSLADTGNHQAAFPFTTAAENPPYGMTFFHRPTNRNSDGRLVIDFMAQGLNLPFLSPYLQGVMSNFGHGANFAASGSEAVPWRYAYSPFSLPVQVNQFKSFKKKILAAANYPGSRVPPLDARAFSNALYVVSIGGNDIKNQFVDGHTVEEVHLYVPNVVDTITSALQDLYEAGARKFLVVNIPAQGCSTFFLTMFAGGPEDYDEWGCLIAHNNVVKAYNELLHKAVGILRTQLPEASFIYADYYRVNMDVITEPAKYGMKDVFKACCGSGGAYNYSLQLSCGISKVDNGVEVKATVCPNPSEYVNWDGIHFTEAFYNVVGKGFLSGKYLEPNFPLQACLEAAASS